MILLPKMIYLFAFDASTKDMNLSELLVYHNNIKYVNEIKDWQGIINKEAKSLTNE